jgi:hypothetical protein
MPAVVERDDIDTAVRTLTGGTIGAGGSRVFTDGTHAFYIAGTKIASWTVADGTFVWEYDHGATIHDGCFFNGRVFIVGAVGTGGYSCRSLLYDSGIVNWSFDHGTELRGVAAAQGRVFVAGVASSHPSGANLRAIHDATGRDATGEGGNGASTGFAWDQVRATDPSFWTITTDGRSLYMVWPVAAPYHLEAIDVCSGDVSRGRALSGALTFPTCDTDYVVARGGPGALIFDRRTFDIVAQVIDADLASIDTDGGYLYFGRLLTGADMLLAQAQRPNRPTYYRKTALASGTYGRTRALVRALTPEE